MLVPQRSIVGDRFVVIFLFPPLTVHPIASLHTGPTFVSGYNLISFTLIDLLLFINIVCFARLLRTAMRYQIFRRFCRSAGNDYDGDDDDGHA